MRHQARDQRHRDRDVAAEDMAERQEHHGAMGAPGKRRIMIDDRPGGGEMLAVGDHRALRIAGRARGVDDEGGVIRIERAHHCVQGGKRIGGGALRRGHVGIAAELGVLVAEHRRVVDHDDEAQRRQPIDHAENLVDVFLVPGDEDARPAVVHQIGELGRRAGRIDPVDDGAGALGGEIGDHPLLARVAHDGDALAAREAERAQPERAMRHQPGIVAPGALAIDAQMLGAERNRVRRRAGALAQELRCGLAAQGRECRFGIVRHAAAISSLRRLRRSASLSIAE